MIFDDDGFRGDFYIEVIELGADGFQKIAKWDMKDKLVNTRTEDETTSQLTQSLHNRTIVVSARLDEPWLRIK